VVSFASNAPLPTFLPTLERFLEHLFQNGEQLLCQIFLDLIKCDETASFQGRLQLRKQKKVCWSQIWRVGWLGYNSCFIFCQKIAHKERQVCWCSVMVQHPTLVRPQLRHLLAYSFPQTLQNCYVKLLVYCVTMWNEFVVDYTMPVKENHQHHLHVGSTHLSFLQSGRSLPLGFNVIAINPGFVSCYDCFQEVFIDADTVKSS